MKKLISYSFILIATIYYANGQQSNIGITAGPSIANYTWKTGNTSIKPGEMLGASAGLLFDFPINKSHISYQPAINFVQKGYKLDLFGEKIKTRINCIEVTPNFVYNLGNQSGLFYLGGGPAIGFNVSGKFKMTGEDSESISFGNNEEKDDMRRFDLGLNLMCGYRFSNGFFVSGGYNKGLNNLVPNGDSDDKMNSSYFSFKLGMLLAGKK